jgi:hypothetical protein
VWVWFGGVPNNFRWVTTRGSYTVGCCGLSDESAPRGQGTARRTALATLPPPPAVTTPPSPPRPSCYNHSTPRPLPTRSHLSHPPPWTVESRALHKVGGQAVQDPAAGGAVEWQGLHKAVSQAVQDPVAGVAVHSNSVNVWIHKLHLIAPSAHAAGIGAAVYGAYSVLLPPRPPRGRARCLRLLPLLGRQFLSDSIRFHHTRRGNSLHLRNLTYY